MLTLMVPRSHMELTLGYELVIYNASEFRRYSESERSWVKLAALRDAMAQHPHSEWFWYLDQVLATETKRSLTIVRNNNEPFNTNTHPLSLTSKSPRPSTARSPCLPSRNNHPHTLPPFSTHK